jgi:uncharacterized membrane protein required for colicin V production
MLANPHKPAKIPRMQTQTLLASFSWFDALAATVLIAGLIHGRKNGMSGELLPMLKWLIVIACAGLGYRIAGDWMIPSIAPEWAYRISYAMVALIIGAALSGIERAMGGKLAGSDAFGKSEFILGMVAGIIRFACVLILFFSFFNARIPTTDEIEDINKSSTKNMGSVVLNPLQVQRSMVMDSITGQLIRNYIGMTIIESVKITSGDTADTPAKRRERMIEDISSSVSSTNNNSPTKQRGSTAPQRKTQPTPAQTSSLFKTNQLAKTNHATLFTTNTPSVATNKESFFNLLLHKIGFSGSKPAPLTNTPGTALKKPTSATNTLATSTNTTAAIKTTAKRNTVSEPKKTAATTNKTIPAKPVLTDASKTATNITITVATPTNAVPSILAPVTNLPITSASSDTNTVAFANNTNEIAFTNAAATNSIPTDSTTNPPSPVSALSTTNATATFASRDTSLVLASTNGITVKRYKAVKTIPATNAPATPR